MELTIGKYRALQQCATSRGAISVLALDHRNNLRNALNPSNPEAVTPQEMSAFKQQLTAAVSPAATAILVDPEFGAGQVIASGALPGQCGLLVSLELTGYLGEPTARLGQWIPGFSALKARRMGATACKILVYYHPDGPTASQIEDFVSAAAEACTAQDMPLFVEPLSYSLDPSRKNLPNAERRQVVIETARRLTARGCDVLKAEFPLDVSAEPDENVWQAACAELTAASQAPWILLSAAVGYDTFLRQVIAACKAGASGVAVGRAVWKESTALQGEERLKFLRTTARERMRRITSLCDALARPWTEVYSAPRLSFDWFKTYAE